MAETDPAKLPAHPANTVAAKAATQSGSDATDTVVAACSLIRIGAFFDGTGNSREHVGLGGAVKSWHTNVDFLEEIYHADRNPASAAVRQVSVNGETREAKFLKRYMRGIGVKENGGTTTYGTAWGTGSEGVESRVAQAMDWLAQDVRDSLRDRAPCDIWFDVFGFSRGAVAARDFANGIRDGEFTYKESKLRVKYLGIYDTVSSVGHAGSMGNYEGVDLSTSRNVAERIVHLTAKDEVRENFPLTLAMSGTRIELVGAHSDVGGGYWPGTEKEVFGYINGAYPGLRKFYQDRWGAVTGGDDKITQKKIRGLTRISLTVTAEHGLQFVALRLMFDQARASALPFPQTLPASIAGHSVALSGTLETYYKELSSGAPSAATEAAVRAKYAHLSISNEASYGAIYAHLPEQSGIRRVSSL